MTQSLNPTLDLSTLETWLWEAACKIRGPVDAPKYKDYILPLIFLKRLSDVFEDEVQTLGEELGGIEIAQNVVEGDHELVRFYVPPQARWSHVNRITSGLGEALTNAVRAISRENPQLSGVIDVTDFNATTSGQRIVGDEQLQQLVQVLNRQRLGLRDVEPDILGRAYEYLLRKFAEGQGQSAGEFYTPRMVGVLMSKILDPQPGMAVYDPACGSAGLLIKCHLQLIEQYGLAGSNSNTPSLPTPGPSLKGREKNLKGLPASVAPLKVYGQEINPTTFAMARMNAFIHDLEAEIKLGDTMRNPRFLKSDGSLSQFDLVTANPMWNQNFPKEMYENDPFERFERGSPPGSSADWGWVQHMVASLGAKGRMAVVLDTGSVSRGSGNQGSNRERDIRKRLIESENAWQGDLIETVILLPENLFYNTTAPGIVMVLNKEKRHPGEILLINASKLFIKGRPKNELTQEQVEQIAAICKEWQAEEGLSAIISIAEAARNDYNLSPSRYVSVDGEQEVLPLEEAVVLLEEAEEERAEADKELDKILKQLGLKEKTL
jgi:type I restriction enzyme M protein